uniref:Uncharacterized protein n=1 Tax=Anguilla anguilla TaxID=7936 RepID=A0A0E9SAK1_ANGAN
MHEIPIGHNFAVAASGVHQYALEPQTPIELAQLCQIATNWFDFYSEYLFFRG